MNVLFLTLGRITEISSRGIYNDLMRKFRDEGHEVYIVTPYERQFKMSTSLKDADGVKILGVKTLNIQKTNVVEKGIGTILLETQYKNAIKKYLKGIKFDLILYSTPPITFTMIISFLKKNNPKAITYLLLKDIFPQNAVDLGMFSKKSIFYKFFRKKEKLLYRLSDYIGCMSEANVRFVLNHNNFIDPSKVEVAPNSIELPLQQQIVDKNSIRAKYNLPKDKLIFIYGGNLGKPQGIDFLIKCLETNKNREDCCFVVIGNGTEFGKLKNWIDNSASNNIFVYERLPKKIMIYLFNLVMLD
jgi:Glycosyl transferases group 1.